MTIRELKTLAFDIDMRINDLSIRIQNDQREIDNLKAALPIIRNELERQKVLESAVRLMKLANANPTSL